MPRGVYKHKPWSDERKRRHSLALMGHPVSESFRIKTSARMRLHPNSKFHSSQKGISWDKGRRQRWSEQQTGKTGNPHSTKTRLLMSRIAKSRRVRTFVDDSKISRKGCEWKIWRESVFKRDKFTCLKCGVTGGEIHPHHIENFSTRKDLRYLVGNGATLCLKHHIEFHSKFGRKNNTRDQLNEFIK